VTSRQLKGRKSQRGTAVVTVLMVTTLITAVGVFAVRAVSQVDVAVGYSRQAAQTLAIAEYGTSAALAQLSTGSAEIYVNQMLRSPETCRANGGFNGPCYKLFRSEIDVQTQALASETLLERTSGAELGSFGSIANTTGDFVVEMTEPGPTGRPVAGTDVGGTGASFKYVKVSLTTTAQVRPDGALVCNAGVASVTSQQGMRARVVVGPIAQSN